MKIEKIEISCDGYMTCESGFYTAFDVMNERDVYHFIPGLNILHGEIDSGNWGISYLLSMYQYERRSREHIIDSPMTAVVNGETVSLKKLWELSCYMVEKRFPLFSTKKTAREQVEKAIKKNHLSESVEDIQRIFHIEDVRFDRPIQATGHEVFRMMAAIAYCYGKEIFCFPWMSKRRFDAFTGHLPDTLRILESLNKIVILPVADGVDPYEFWQTSSGKGLLQEYGIDTGGLS